MAVWLSPVRVECGGATSREKRLAWTPAHPLARVSIASLRAGVTKHPEQREHENAEVEPEGPIPDVEQVVLDTLIERRIAAKAVNLCPARDPGLDVVSEHVAGY